jgi:hypothetical protein
MFLSLSKDGAFSVSAVVPAMADCCYVLSCIATIERLLCHSLVRSVFYSAYM